MPSSSKLLYVESHGCDSFITKTIDDAVEYIQAVYGYLDLNVVPYSNGCEVVHDSEDGLFRHCFRCMWVEVV